MPERVPKHTEHGPRLSQVPSSSRLDRAGAQVLCVALFRFNGPSRVEAYCPSVFLLLFFFVFCLSLHGWRRDPCIPLEISVGSTPWINSMKDTIPSVSGWHRLSFSAADSGKLGCKECPSFDGPACCSSSSAFSRSARRSQWLACFRRRA